MTVQNFTGLSGFWLPGKVSWSEGNEIPVAVDSTVDAADEYVHLNGYCVLEAKTGTKTISSSGGKIHFLVGAATITFADAGTTLRVGIQDMSTSGVPGRGDGTFDVYDDLVGGTDTLTATTWTTVTMSSGTKDITHGQLISVGIGMTARGGADTMKVRSVRGTGNTQGQIPNVVLETSGPTFTLQNALPNIVIEFDDGTFGYVYGAWISSTGALATVAQYNSGSTPDEYCNIIRTVGPVNAMGMSCTMFPAAASSDFEMILYSDPLGTPAVVEAVAVDASQLGTTGSVRNIVIPFTTVRALSANTNYAVAIRPTTANNVGIYTHDVAAAGHWSGLDMGSNCYSATRSNQTGAFSGTTTRRVYGLSLNVCGIDDGAGGGGGGGIRLAGPGGLAA